MKEINLIVSGMMCGDGVNDSPALVSTDIGMSVNDGTEIAMGLLTKFGLTINPMIASLAMVASSTTVILNTLRLKISN